LGLDHLHVICDRGRILCKVWQYANRLISPTPIIIDNNNLEPAKRMRATQVHDAGAFCAGRFVAPLEARADKSTYVASGRQSKLSHVTAVFGTTVAVARFGIDFQGLRSVKTFPRIRINHRVSIQ
jgi:hypothetical protein